MKPFEQKIASLELNEPPVELKQRVLENAASGAKISTEKTRLARVGMVLSSKWFLLLLLPTSLFGSVGALVLSVEAHYAGKRWAEVQAMLEQEGETLDWKSFYPKPVPDDQNFMATPALLGIELRGPNSRPKTPLDLKQERISALQRFRIRQEEGDPIDFAKIEFHESGAKYPRDFHLIGDSNGSPEEAVLRLIDADAALFAELTAAAKRPFSQPATSIEDRVKAVGSKTVYSIPTVHLQPMQQLGKLAPLRALAAARLDDRQKARESLEIFFKCRDCVNSEGVVIDGLVSASMRAILERYLPDILRENCWTEEDLVWLQRKVSEGNGFDEGLRSLRSEMARTAEYFNQCLKMSTAERRELYESYGSDQTAAKLKSLIPDGIIQRNQATAVEWRYQYDILPLKTRDIAAIFESQSEAEAEIDSLRRFPFTSTLAIEISHGLGAFLVKFPYSEMQRRMMELGVALERYQRANGTFPDKLDALVPEFVEAIPDNLFGEADDTSLRYERRGEGYQLSAPNVRYPDGKRKLDFFR